MVLKNAMIAERSSVFEENAMVFADELVLVTTLHGKRQPNLPHGGTRLMDAATTDEIVARMVSMIDPA